MKLRLIGQLSTSFWIPKWVEWDFSLFQTWTCLFFFCLLLPLSQAKNLRLSSLSQRPSARLESLTTVCFYSPNTRQQLKVKVGWEGLSFCTFLFLSSVGLKIYQCYGNGMNWDQILAPPFLSSWPWANALAFLRLSCLSVPRGWCYPP